MAHGNFNVDSLEEWQSLDSYQENTSSEILISEDEYFQNFDIDRVTVRKGQEAAKTTKCDCPTPIKKRFSINLLEQPSKKKCKRRKRKNKSTETSRFNIKELRPNTAIQNILRALFRQIAKPNSSKDAILGRSKKKKKYGRRKEGRNIQHNSRNGDISFRVNDNLKITIKGLRKILKLNLLKHLATPPKSKTAIPKTVHKSKFSTSRKRPIDTHSQRTFLNYCPLLKFNEQNESSQIFGKGSQKKSDSELMPKNVFSCSSSCPLLKDKDTQYEAANFLKKDHIKVTVKKGNGEEEVRPHIVREGKKVKIIIKLKDIKSLDKNSHETRSNIDSGCSSVVSQITDNLNSYLLNNSRSSGSSTAPRKIRSEPRNLSTKSICLGNSSLIMKATCSRATCPCSIPSLTGENSSPKAASDVDVILPARHVSRSYSKTQIDPEEDFETLRKYWEEIETMLNKRIKQLKPTTQTSNIKITIHPKRSPRRKLQSRRTKLIHKTQNTPSILIIRYPKEKKYSKAATKSGSKNFSSTSNSVVHSRKSISFMKLAPQITRYSSSKHAPQETPPEANPSSTSITPTMSSTSQSMLDKNRLLYCKQFCPACHHQLSKPSNVPIVRSIDNVNSIPVQTDPQPPISIVIYLNGTPSRKKSTDSLRRSCDRKRCVSFSDLTTSRRSTPIKECKCVTGNVDPQTFLDNFETSTSTQTSTDEINSNSQLQNVDKRSISTFFESNPEVTEEELVSQKLGNTTDNTTVGNITSEKFNYDGNHEIGGISEILNSMSIPEELITDVENNLKVNKSVEKLENKET